MQEEEAAEGQVDRLGEQQFLASLSDGHDLRGRRRQLRHLVACSRVAVDGVHPPVPTHDLGQSHAHVAAAGAHVGAAPPLAQAEAVEGGHERPPVHVVAQAELDHGATLRCRP